MVTKLLFGQEENNFAVRAESKCRELIKRIAVVHLQLTKHDALQIVRDVNKSSTSILATIGELPKWIAVVRNRRESIGRHLYKNCMEKFNGISSQNMTAIS